MKFNSENKIIFEIINNDDSLKQLLVVTNPVYIYKVGDKFGYYNILESESIIRSFEVTDVKHDLNFFGVCSDQTITVFVKELFEEGKKPSE